MAYGVRSVFQNVLRSSSPRKIVSSQAVSITQLSVKGVNLISVKYA